MKTNNLITKAINIAGLKPLAEACGKSYQAIRKWEAQGHLPLTEWAELTNYSEQIEKATGGEVTKAELLDAKPKKSAA